MWHGGAKTFAVVFTGSRLSLRSAGTTASWVLQQAPLSPLSSPRKRGPVITGRYDVARRRKNLRGCVYWVPALAALGRDDSFLGFATSATLSAVVPAQAGTSNHWTIRCGTAAQKPSRLCLLGPGSRCARPGRQLLGFCNKRHSLRCRPR